MLMVAAFFGADAVMEATCSAIGFLVAYYAFKAYRFSGNVFFKLLYLGFMAISSAMIFRSSLIIILLSLSPAPFLTFIIKEASLIQSLVRALGYFLFIVAYVKQLKASKMEALVLTPILVSPLIELACICMLFYLVAHMLMLLLSTRNRDLLFILSGFTLFLASHALFFASISYSVLYLVGHVVQLLGSLCFLTVLVRVTKAR